jgi:GNAT superfamily N-acetyltransferase
MEMDRLTLSLAAAEPQRVTRTLALPDGETVLYRPLLPTDVERLTEFLSSLSPTTRHFWDLDTYDRAAAQEMCAAINCYDKFRMVALNTEESSLLADFEFSFDLVENDYTRFRSYGITLSGEETCRFGPCIRDAYQHRGLGSALMPSTLEIARRFGKRCVILWGGVLRENARAIHFYQKHGFQIAGAFQESQGRASLDMLLYL